MARKCSIIIDTMECDPKKGKGWQQLFGGPPEKDFGKPQRKKPSFNESAMIRGCVKWYRMQYHGKHIIKIDNEGKRSKAVGALKKAEGLTRGASDLFIPEPMIHQIVIRQKAKNDIIEIDRNSGKILTPPFIDVPSTKQYHGMWLEGKFGDNDLTDSQIAFQKDMEQRGYYVGTFYDLDEFIHHCNIYFGTNYKSNKWKSSI